MGYQNYIKSEFPIFNNHPNLVYLDSASTTHKPSSVIDAIQKAYQESYANMHRSLYTLGFEANKIYIECKKDILEYFGKSSEEYAVVFTSGVTDGINKVAYSSLDILKDGGNLVISEMEHHSNILPWQQVSRKKRSELRYLSISQEASLEMSNIETIIDKDTQITSIIHISNATGTVNDVETLSKCCKTHHSRFLIDAAQSCPFELSELKKVDYDILFCSAHKMFGPSGLGFMIGKKEYLEKLPPFQYGGGMVRDVGKWETIFLENERKHEAGTLPIAQIWGLKAAIRMLKDLDMKDHKNRIIQLNSKLKSFLDKNGFKIIGSLNSASWITSLYHPEIHPHDMASFLSSKSIAVRSGHHCAQLLLKKYNLGSSLRISWSIYNDESDLEKVFSAFIDMKNFFRI